VTEGLKGRPKRRLWRWGLRRWGLGLLILLAFVALSLPLALRSETVNRAVDRAALGDKVAFASSRFELKCPLPFDDGDSLENLTRALPLRDLRIEPLDLHRYSDEGLIQEKLSFESTVKLRHAESNRAVAYIYRHGPLGRRPVVVWVPGLYVSDIAFRPIFWFFDEIFARGVDVVFYVLPYHLERSPEGMESGQALLATDLADHLGALAQGLADLRSLTAWLRGQGVKRLGAIGGSFGGGLLLRQITMEPAYDFMTVFIPLLSWEDVIYANETTTALRESLAGLTTKQQASLRRAWRAMDPASHIPQLAAERISALPALYDQVARSEPFDAWRKAWGIKRVHPLNRGHTLALFTSELYEAYGKMLDTDLRATQKRSSLSRDPIADPGM